MWREVAATLRRLTVQANSQHRLHMAQEEAKASESSFFDLSKANDNAD